jgi:hypothetical protein
MKRIFVPLAVVLAFAGCARVRIEAPEGFAPMKARAGGLAARGEFRAISPEGLAFRVRVVKNEPRMDLEFWRETLGNHLEREGYRGGETSVFTAGEREGVIFAWTVPYGPETWTYLTGFLVSGKRIYLAEAAGEHTLMRRHRSAIESSLRTLRP